MQRVSLGNEIALSRLVYGMWRLGDDSDTSQRHVQAKIESCLEQGISSFDQADIYGNYQSEAILGQTLKAAPQLREQMEIITKCDIMLLSDKFPKRTVKHYDTSAAHIQHSVESSLSLMNIDTIDVLLLHRPDPLMDHIETGAALDSLVASGKVRSVGVSNFMQWDWTLLQSAMKTPLVTNQIEINLLNNACFTDGSLAYLQERGVKPMAWSPLAGGELFNTASPAAAALSTALTTMASAQSVGVDAVAIAWLLKHPATILPVVGTNNLTRIGSISDAMKVEMSREQWFELFELANGHEVP